MLQSSEGEGLCPFSASVAASELTRGWRLLTPHGFASGE